jgi:hypothetical protein
VNKQKALKIIFAVWIILWIFFLAREDKDGQYSTLRYLYTHDSEEKTRYVMGGELYDFLISCRENMPAGSTYELSGFQEFSIDEVRARYFLWPLKSVSEKGEFEINYNEKKISLKKGANR